MKVSDILADIVMEEKKNCIYKMEEGVFHMNKLSAVEVLKL